MTEPTLTRSLRAPAELFEKLQEEADRGRRSRNNLIIYILSNWLEESSADPKRRR